MLPDTIPSPCQELVARVNDMRADGWSFDDILYYARLIGSTSLYITATNLRLREAKATTNESNLVSADVIVCDPKV